MDKEFEPENSENIEIKKINDEFKPPVESENSSQILLELPNSIPILPLRGLVVYPKTAIPLTVGQPRSIRLIDDVMSSDRLIGMVTSRNSELENPGPEDLYDIGTAATIHRMFRAPDGTIRLVIQGLSRFRITNYIQEEPYLKAIIQPFPETNTETIEVEALTRNVQDQFQHIAEMIPSIPGELVASIASLTDPLQTIYTIANFQRMETQDGQALLELDTAEEKLKKLVSILTRESEVLELGQKIQNEAREEIDKVQREYFLREQLKAIEKELGENDELTHDVEEFKQKIETCKMPEEADKLARRELERLSHLPSAAAEYGVIRTFLEWLVALPWQISTVDNLDIPHARLILDADHFGLEDVKERILEFLAVRKLRDDRSGQFIEDDADEIHKKREGVILCFIGPPGVGKTSLGRSIAKALGRKFIRLSLGGLRDEAEIRGHRRTYIGAMPGRIIQSLRRVESKNPVFMLDEIDKLSSDFHGDPSSALLEVLDPEQNFEFRDNYLEAPFDLSKVFFITTANQIETIPLPLLDRMEIIHLAGYTDNEKLNIAVKYLINRQLRENSLNESEITFEKEAILSIIRMYTKESGVRNLEREIGTICRKIATSITEGKIKNNIITPETVHELLGKPKYQDVDEVIRRTSLPGVATGLAWTPVGGTILFIEAAKMPGSKSFVVTGSIGKVMEESAKTAYSLLRSKSSQLGIDPEIFNQSDIHLHVPAGAQPKDGPSAGVTITTALASLMTGRHVKSDLAMTGEITLKGLVLPVGGIKEKLLAAHRSKLKTVLIPKQNEIDLDEIPDEVKKELNIVFVENIDDIFKLALENPKKQKSRNEK
ncbi:MAG: endopeptidase La [Chloroflexi bacterium HGW-Chloroflexi-8]|nr:MAG: endopeptidase La [Chloroflexi bacterium HGW-Chloroflexi-8]